MDKINNKLIFKINNDQFIEIVTPIKLKKIDRFTEVKIFFHLKNKKYCIFENDFIFIALEDMQEKLIKAIDFDLYLDKSIVKDIGFLWNEYLQDKTDHIFIEQKKSDDSCEFWIGDNYMLWSSSKNITTWLYNRDKLIYLELTESYKWNFRDPKKNEKFVPYEEWIKGYKPLAIIEITRDIAEEWLRKAKNLLQEIEKH